MISPFARGVIGANPGILVLSRLEAQEYRGDQPYALISIRDPRQQDVRVGEDPNCVAVLPLEFHDVSDPEWARDQGLTCIQAQVAHQVVEFVQAWRGKVGLLVVHCEAGASRSAGVAAGLALWLHGDDRLFYERYMPNSLCKTRVLRACERLGLL